MANTLIGVFASYQNAKDAIETIRQQDSISPITIMNRLPKITPSAPSLKLDGVISGVSDVFIGTAPFVNPMAAAGLPPQEVPHESGKSKGFVWNRFGVGEREASQYRKYIDDGKTVVAVKTEQDLHPIQESFKRYHAEIIRHYSS